MVKIFRSTGKKRPRKKRPRVYHVIVLHSNIFYSRHEDFEGAWEQARYLQERGVETYITSAPDNLLQIKK